MTTIVIAPSNVAGFPDGGGHFWVYMQYVHGLRSLGCDVYWLEHLKSTGDIDRDQSNLKIFLGRMRDFDLAGKVIVQREGSPFPPSDAHGGVSLTGSKAAAVYNDADALLNFYYAIDQELLARFRRTILVDIDPGLLQFWISQGQIQVPRHDLYVSTGETVGTVEARFPSCGIDWHRIRPVVSLPHWPVTHRPEARRLTTVTGWWGDEWIRNGTEVYENNKRVTFMQFAEIARRTTQALELATYMGEAASVEQPDSLSRSSPLDASSAEYPGDAVDRSILESNGWTVRHSKDVSADPESYRKYIQESRGEFSCAKPSCIKFQNAWVSDRSLCYLASGKPVIVQHTGRSRFLPDAEGMFRFKTLDEAVAAIESMNSNYAHHCRMARALAEEQFDAEKVLNALLDFAL
ncbi:MAG TPA: hypothetical protein VMR74_03570 [Gammaproteobacteria bacterium]|nr:hypothetical protein [Gammaproteobacteria bacterium]